MVKFYYNKTTYAYLYKEDSETWAQGDSDSKYIGLYFGSVAGDPQVFTNGFTSTTIYDQSCELIIVRPDGESSQALSCSPQPEGYYKLLIDEWITTAEGTLELFARLKTASTTTAYGKATKAVAAGAPPSDPTVYVSQEQLAAVSNALSDAVLETATKVAIADITTTTAEGDPDANTKIYSVTKADELLVANSVTDQAYTDAEVLKITNGTYTADKATKDADGNTISTTYIKANGTVPMAAALPMGANKITGLANGSADDDAINVGQVAFSLLAKQDTSAKNQANGYAGLDSSGKLANAQIPAIALVNTFEVASEAAMLALSTAQLGDVAVRSDENKSYILGGNGLYSEITDWILLRTPTDTVLSVNGETGVVVIDAVDIASTDGTVQGDIDDLQSRMTAEEAYSTDHETRIGTAETEIDALQANISDLDDANLNESHSRMSPALLGTITNCTPVSDAYWNGRLNEIRLDGLTLAQLIKNGNFVTTGNWLTQNATFTVTNNMASITASAQYGRIYQSTLAPIISGHKYFVSIQYQHTQANISYFDYISSVGGTVYSLTNDGNLNTFKGVFTADRDGTVAVSLRDANASGWKPFKQGETKMIDLTALGTHPTLGVAWSSLTAEQVSAYIGNYKTNAEMALENTNIATTGEFASDITGWSTLNIGTPVVASGIVSFTATAQNARLYRNQTYIVGNTYMLVASVKASSNTVEFIGFNIGSAFNLSRHTGNGSFQTLYVIGQAISTGGVIGINDSKASAWSQIEVDYIRVYDITDSAITSGLYSFKPLAITATDGTITRSLDLSGLGRMNSLPSGIKDEFDTYVDTTSGERVHEHTLRTMRINLPNNGSWTKVAYDYYFTNTDFDSAVTGWTSGNAPSPTWVSGGYLQQNSGNTGTATTLSSPTATVSGHKYYVAIKYRTTGTTSTYLRLQDSAFSPTVFAEQLTPTQNEWYTQTATFTAGMFTGKVVAKHGHPSGAEGDTSMQVDYFRIYDLTAIFNAGNEPTQAQFEGLLAMSAYTLFRIGLNGYAGSSTLTVPANNALPDAFISSAYAWSTYDALLTSAAAGIALSATSHIYLILPNATADTEAELYTYLQANQMVYVGGITEEVETNVIGYLKQTGTDMTIEITSDTFVLESGFSVKYVKDTDTVIAALAARVTALE